MNDNKNFQMRVPGEAGQGYTPLICSSRCELVSPWWPTLPGAVSNCHASVGDFPVQNGPNRRTGVCLVFLRVGCDLP